MSKGIRGQIPMGSRVGLSSRIMIHLAVLSLIILAMGFVSIWQAVSSQRLLDHLISSGMAARAAALEMQSALANHKGFATYYYLDSDPKWLRELDFYRNAFTTRLETAYQVDTDPAHRLALDMIRGKNESYIRKKDEVIRLYGIGERTRGEMMHWEVRALFFELNGMVNDYGERVDKKISAIMEDSRKQTARANTAVLSFLALSLMLLGVFGFLLLRHVIGPIRRIAGMTRSETGGGYPENEVTALGRRVRDLVSDIENSRMELKHSKSLLMNAEKMALVGNLATEVAHSIRNPMTSINMRLFSLQRNLEMTPKQEDDLAVVAEEMRRLDTILRNFLEFSRPHKLRKQYVDIAGIVDMALELLRYRLEHSDVEALRQMEDGLPFVPADADLIKEVFVNLIINACEAMADGGRIIISGHKAVDEEIGPVVRVVFSDSGPGIPEAALNLVMEPFYTTKPDGTGLGLFTAARIVTEHGGSMTFESTGGEGASVAVMLPIVRDIQNNE